MRNLKLAIVAISFGIAGAAFAQAPGGPPGGGPPNPLMAAMIQACQADMAKVCAGKQQGPDMRACMEANASQLSKECNDARAKMMAAMPAGGPPPR
jgi:hypothetical protein